MDGVSFEIEKGESVGIAGESACGKSTLGLSIMRTVSGGRIAAGKISIGGVSILELPAAKFDAVYRWKKVSMIFQGAMNSLDPVYTIRQQFLDILRQHGGKDDEQALSHALESVGLEDSVLKRYPHELSGGMKQRVVIAMALLLRPDVVIADEPTTALDVLVQSQILNLFKSLKKQGVSFVIISHDLAVISEMCEKVGVMYGGKMVEFGALHEVFENPKHPYTRALLRSVPKLRSEQRPTYIRGSPPSLLDPKKGCRFFERCPDAMEKCKNDPLLTKTDTGYVQCYLYE